MTVLGVLAIGTATRLLIGSYGACIGAVRYFILVLQDPFNGAMRVMPQALEVICRDVFTVAND